MIGAMFTYLSGALESNLIIAFSASFLWGVLSILLSPCHLASIPLIIGFIDDQGRISIKRAFYLGSLYSLGILITIVIIGFITAFTGRMLGDIGSYGNYIVGIMLLIVGLYLLEVISIPFLAESRQPFFRKKGLFAAFVLGLVFGIAVGPCSFAYMAPILGISFKIASTNIISAMLLILFYAIGHCSVIVLAGTFTGVVQKYLNYNQNTTNLL